ncbi:helix-turn-helix transcriptional regulator [Deinococcus carri]
MPQEPPVDIYAKLREYIKRSTKTQRKIAEEAGIPNPSYLSHMVNGRVNWVEGDYFRPLSEALGLSRDEIRELKPEIIWEEPSPPPSRALSAAAKGHRIPKPQVMIPDTLREAAEQYGHLAAFAGLGEHRWQHFMASVSRRHTPETPEGWLEEFTALKRLGYDPQEPEE